MALHTEIVSGLNDQADHVMNNGAPGTAAICRALIALAEGDNFMRSAYRVVGPASCFA